jgi:hypothetical protein
MDNQPQFDAFLEVLSDSYRRELLLALTEHNPQDDDEPDPLDIHRSASDGGDQFDIFMYHLPKLEQLGVITWNRETDEISKGPDWDELAPLLELVNNHQDELPSEWFEKPPAADSSDEPSESC